MFESLRIRACEKYAITFESLEEGIIKKCTFLLTKIEGTSNYCYACARNNLLALNKLRNFRVTGEKTFNEVLAKLFNYFLE